MDPKPWYDTAVGIDPIDFQTWNDGSAACDDILLPERVVPCISALLTESNEYHQMLLYPGATA